MNEQSENKTEGRGAEGQEDDEVASVSTMKGAQSTHAELKWPHKAAPFRPERGPKPASSKASTIAHDEEITVA
jgi:hypothetical protein